MEMKQKFDEDAIFKNSSLFLSFKMSQIKKKINRWGQICRFKPIHIFLNVHNLKNQKWNKDTHMGIEPICKFRLCILGI